MPELVGRDAETKLLLGCVERATRGPVAVLLDGEAGIGKTSLWKMAISEAQGRGARVLTAAVAEFERELSLVGLSDLLASVTDEEIAARPASQRSALDTALLRRDGHGTETDWRAVSAGVLGLLRAFSNEGPIVVGIDDVQWLDRTTANVLGTALRRLGSDPVLVLMTRRTPGPEGAFDPSELFRHELQVIEVEALSWESLEQMIHSRLGSRLTPQVAKKIHGASGGNPFYALEIARSLGSIDLTRGGRLPVPKTLTKVISDRLSGLSDAALQALLVTASVSRPTAALVEKALGDEVAVPGLQEARAADLLEVRGDSLRFTHPLFASTIYEATAEKDRRELHERLSDLVEDIEQRADHLARARSAPDEEVAIALDEASASARTRGAIERAAELAWTAVDFSDPAEIIDRAERVARAAQEEILFGDRARLAAVLESTINEVPRGPTRARLWLSYAEVIERLSDGVAGLSEALDDAQNDPDLQTAIFVKRATLRFVHGDGAGAESDAHSAVSVARRSGDRNLIVTALTHLGSMQTMTGDPDAAQTLAEAVSMPEARDLEPVYESPTTFLAMVAEMDDDLHTARKLYLERLERAEEQGDLSSVTGLLFHLIGTEMRSARFERVDEIAQRLVLIDAEGLDDQATSMACYARGLAAVSLGRISEAKESAGKGAAIADKMGDAIFLILNRWVLGLAALAVGDFDDACLQLVGLPVIARRIGALDPNRLLFDADLIEALLGAGRIEEAESHLDDFRSRATDRSRTRALALAARCQGMLADKRGDHEEALASLGDALELHTKIPDQRFELARSLLTRGIVERRAKQRGAARTSLARAHDLFAELGNGPWAAKAEAEAKRIGGRAPSPLWMTPTEEQVADLVGQGLSNKDVAERLYLSVKTVEANLSRIYRKLDVRSRTQLAQRLHADATELDQPARARRDPNPGPSD